MTIAPKFTRIARGGEAGLVRFLQSMHAHTDHSRTGRIALADGSPRTFTSYNDTDRDCYCQNCQDIVGHHPTKESCRRYKKIHDKPYPNNSL